MIPNIAHFNYGLGEQKEDFLFVYYIAVLSCKVINNPDKIYLYYHYEPQGQWWEKTKEICELVHVPIPTHIGTKEIKKTAHKSDILRMLKLKEVGGVYLDIDTICVRPYVDLLYNKFVIANEITESGKNMGLCNAIMMSEPNGTFINNWINNYETFFEPDGWQEASTFLPWEIAKHDTNVTILKPENFLLPSWENINLIFEKPNEISPDLIVLHYWNQYSQDKYLKQITNFDWVIGNAHTLYGKLLKNIFNKTCEIKRPKIGMCMFYDEPIKSYGELNYKINKMYCDKYNIDLILSCEKKYSNRHSAWERLPLLLDNIDKYDYLMWIDADAFFFNHSPDIFDIIDKHKDKNFIFSKDTGNININTGFFIVKNCDYCRQFLRIWAYDETIYKNNTFPYWWDQGVLINIYDQNLLNIKNHSVRLDYGFIQCFERKEDALIYHLAGKSSDVRYNTSKKYLEDIIC